MKSHAPIGLFDSGVGGLTVLSALTQALPHEDFVYLGDTARVPYGSKSATTVVRYAENNAHALLAQHDLKMLLPIATRENSFCIGPKQDLKLMFPIAT